MLAGAALLGVGAVAVWDLFEVAQPIGGQQAVTLLQPQSTQQSTSSTSDQSSKQTTTQLQSSSKSQSTTSQNVPVGYVFVTGLAALNGKFSAYFNHPTGGLSILVNLTGHWKAFSATCTHAPCTVGYSSSQIQCPCHNGVFDPSNGSVVSGPPPSPLPEYGVLIQGNNLYVSA
jgi:Rieske Fe-S protein